MTSVAAETTQAVELMERVETLESVARSLPEQDDRRSRLLRLVEKDLATAAPLRPRVAAQLLGLSEKTVRSWVEEGVLLVADTSSPRLLLDVERVHDVLHLVKDLRAAGTTVGLLDEVHRRLADASWFDRADLAESLAQMRRGEGHLIAAAPQRRSAEVPCEVKATPIAQRQLAGLRGPRRKAFDAFVTMLVNDGCRALAYRLTGTEPLPRLWVQRRRAKDRVVVAFEGPTAWVLLLGPHDEGDRRVDVYAALYQLAGVDPPELPRTKPPCCDEDDQPPAVDGQVLDDLVRRARSLHR